MIQWRRPAGFQIPRWPPGAGLQIRPNKFCTCSEFERTFSRNLRRNRNPSAFRRVPRPGNLHSPAVGRALDQLDGNPAAFAPGPELRRRRAVQPGDDRLDVRPVSQIEEMKVLKAEKEAKER